MTIALRIALLATVAFGVACAGNPYTAESQQPALDAGPFKAQVRMECKETGCPQLVFLVDSFADDPITVAWEEAVYLRDDVEHGGFYLRDGQNLFDPVEYEANDEVEPGTNYQRAVVPEVSLLEEQNAAPALTVPLGGWDVKVMHLGKHGLRVPVRVAGKTEMVELHACLRKTEDPKCN